MLSQLRFTLLFAVTLLTTNSASASEPVDFYFETKLIHPTNSSDPASTVIYRKSLTDSESPGIFNTEDQLDWSTTSPNGATLALFLVAHDSAKTSRLLFTDLNGKTLYETKETENILEPGFFSPSGNYYAALIGDPAGNHVGGPANYRVDVIDIAARSRKTVFETIKPSERPKGWFRDSVQTLDWWIRSAQWTDENTLLLVSFTGLQIVDVTQSKVTDSIAIPMYCTKSMRVTVSPSGRFLLYGPCPDPADASQQMVYDLQNRRNVTELMSPEIIGGDGSNAIVKAKWLGGAPQSLIVELSPRRTKANGGDPEAPQLSERTLRLIDVQTNTLLTESIESEFSIENYSRTITLPANSAVLVKNGKYNYFGVDSLR